MAIKNLEGATLSSRFRLARQLGRGGYGSVFEAEQLSVGRKCAVKVLAPKTGKDTNTEQRFSQEARTTSRLTHPNSIVIYDFGRDEEHDVLWLAMELLDGETLQKRVRREGPMSVERCLHIVRQVAASLQEAHEIGLVHRDIKPGNIMLLDRSGDPDFVKVIDFGIAKVVRDTLMPDGNMTQTGRILGTPKYMAPEQIRDTTVDGRADLYALATVVYALLTGRVPFSNGSAMEIASRQLTERPPKIRDIAPDLDVGMAFESVLLQALSKDPARRFASILAFVEALEDAALTGENETPLSFEASGARAEPSVEVEVESSDDEDGADDQKRAREPALDEDTSALAETTDEVAPTTQPMQDGMTPTAEVGRPEGPETQATLAVQARPSDDATMDTFAVSSQLDATRESRAPKSETAESEPGQGGASVVRWVAAASVVCVLVAVGVWFAAGDESATANAEPEVATAAAPAEADPSQSPEPAPGSTREPAEPSEPSANVPRDGADEEPETSGADEDKAAAGAELKKVSEGQTAGDTAAAEPDAGAELADGPDATSEPKSRRMTIRAIPWGELFVDGRSMGRGSKFRVDVSMGTHEFMLKQNGEVRARRTVDVSAGYPRIIELVAD